jgi:hypothetical protein
MRRDYHAEGAKLSEESRDKGRFPHVYENLGPEPVEVQSNAHLRQIMKEKGLVRHEPDADARARYRDRTRRFY